MLFQTYYRVDPWGFEPPLSEFGPIQFDDPGDLFSLRLRYKQAMSEGGEPYVLIQTLHRTEDVPDDVCAVFSGEVEIEWGHGEDQDGFGGLPPSYREFVVALHSEMDRQATDLFNIVRWRVGVVGGPLILESDWMAMRWHDAKQGEPVFDEHGFLNRQMISGDGFTWKLPEVQDVIFDQKCREVVEELLEFQSRQPLYHDLFREAWQNQRRNPRSALVMGIAAAETGFKATLIDLEPSTTWLVENLQSPPLDRMLRDYMARLPARNQIGGEVRRPPKQLITTIKSGIELRNKLVHGREDDLSAEVVRRTLEAVRDLLYLLDYYRGHDWALERITPAVVAALHGQ